MVNDIELRAMMAYLGELLQVSQMEFTQILDLHEKQNTQTKKNRSYRTERRRRYATKYILVYLSFCVFYSQYNRAEIPSNGTMEFANFDAPIASSDVGLGPSVFSTRF